MIIFFLVVDAFLLLEAFLLLVGLPLGVVLGLGLGLGLLVVEAGVIEKAEGWADLASSRVDGRGLIHPLHLQQN
jgi:hypothetical protein